MRPLGASFQSAFLSVLSRFLLASFHPPLPHSSSFSLLLPRVPQAGGHWKASSCTLYPATCDPKGHGSDGLLQITISSPRLASARQLLPYAYSGVCVSICQLQNKQRSPLTAALLLTATSTAAAAANNRHQSSMLGILLKMAKQLSLRRKALAAGCACELPTTISCLTTASRERKIRLRPLAAELHRFLPPSVVAALPASLLPFLS